MAINTIVVADDSLIVDLVVRKKYALTPQLIIVVTPLAALTAQGGSQQSFEHRRVRVSRCSMKHSHPYLN